MSNEITKKLKELIETKNDYQYILDDGKVLRASMTINGEILRTGINTIYTAGKTGSVLLDETEFKHFALPINEPVKSKLFNKYKVPSFKNGKIFYSLSDIYNNSIGELKNVQGINLSRILNAIDSSDNVSVSISREVLQYMNITIEDELPLEYFSEIYDEETKVFNIAKSSYLRSIVETAKINAEILQRLNLYSSLEEAKLRYSSIQRKRK